MNRFFKNVTFYLLIIIVAIWMIDYYSASTVSKTDITYSAFMKHVQQDEVKQVTIVDNVISGKLKDGKDFSTVAPSDPLFFSAFILRQAVKDGNSPNLSKTNGRKQGFFCLVT